MLNINSSSQKGRLSGASNGMKFELPKLKYGYDALEPWLDAKTMEIHHTKHHQTYTDKMNAILEKYPDLKYDSVEAMLADFVKLPLAEADKIVFKNMAGGYINHNLFWEVMAPLKQVDSKLVKEINQTFGSIEQFKEKFSQLATGLFGSGWTWLVRNQKGLLEIYNLPNQDSPLLQGHQPIFCLDLWEHAYYLKYQNRRPEYIQNWWNILKMI
jgi:superoxide dismutase, Fe-Mn family